MLDQLFFLTILLVFLVVLTSIWLQRKRDACLLNFHGSQVSIEMEDGSEYSGRLHVFHNGLEVRFQAVQVIDGQERTSRLFFETELKSIQKISRHTYLMDDAERKVRERRIKRAWHPSAFHRACRKGRNLLNLLGDAFHQSLSLFLGRLKQVQGKGLSAQQDRLQKLGSSMIDLAANSYEPILEPWIGHRVVVEGSNSETLTGILKDYTGTWLELLDVSNQESFLMDTSKEQMTEGIEFRFLSREAPHGSAPQQGMVQLFNTNSWPVKVLSLGHSDGSRELAEEISPHNSLNLELSPREASGSQTFQFRLESCKKADLCLPRAVYLPRHGAEIIS